MKKNILVSLFVTLTCQIGLAQTIDKIKLDNYFNTLEENNKFMGSVAVSQNGKVIYSKSVGFSDIEDNIKASKNTKYRIGSISKTFTAALVLKAFEEGKLNLNQTIDKWYPNIINSNKISVSNLLNHRSGIHSFTDDADYLDWHTQPKSEKEMIDIIASRGSDFNPDEKANYSNSNYVLLTYILEKTFNKTYSELVYKYISKPIGLENTKVFDKINPKNNDAESYKFVGKWELENETHYTIPLGAGAIVSTPNDLVKFSDALFNGKIINKSSLEMIKTIKDSYGLGLFKMPFYNKVGYGHTGGIDGFNSVFSHFEDGNFSYALNSNAINYNINNISLAVLSAIYDKPYDIPSFSNYKHTDDELVAFSGTYTTTQIPIKITVSKKHDKLFAQATGQSAFPLEATDKGKFEFDQAGIVLEFNANNKTMILNQGGGKFTFTKE